MEIVDYTNKSGLKCLFIKDPGAKTSSVQFWFRAGSALESKKEQGIAHFLEHMFFKGTKKRKGNQIAKDVESYGGDINAFTSFDFTCYYINCPGSKTTDSVDILCDMVCSPLFQETDIPAEREVVLEEFKRSIDSPSQYNFTTLQENFFSGGYSHQILGTKKTISSFSRKQLIEFRNKYYNKENSLLIIAGPDNEVEKTKRVLQKFSLPSGDLSKFKNLNIKQDGTTSIHEKHTSMATLTLVAQASSFDSKKAPYEDFVMGVLGFGESSRLYSNLVINKNIASSANASSMFMTKGGAHFIKVSFEPKDIKKVTKIIIDEINDLIKNGLNETEVQRLKKQYLSSKIYDLETTEAYAFSKGHGYAQNGDIHSEDKFIERFQSLSTDKINDCLDDVIPRDWKVSLQLPEGKSNENIKDSLKTFEKNLKSVLKKRKDQEVKTKIFSKHDNSLSYHKIKEGIHLVHKKNTKVKTFCFHTYLKGGLTDETNKNNGTYHFITSLLNASTLEMNKLELRNYFEQRAVSYSTFSGKNAYGTTLNGLSSDFNEVFATYANSLLHSKFSKTELDQEKNVTKRILRAEKKDPARMGFKNISNTIFKDHPYGLSQIGDMESITKITINQLKLTHKKNLKKSPIVFCYSGPESAETIKEQINSNFKSLAPRADDRKLVSKKIDIKNSSDCYIPFKREQTHILYCFQTMALKNSETQAIKILHTFLSGQSSKLFTEVRDEKGLCYSVQPIFFNAMEGGYFGIYMGSSNEKVDDALDSIKGIISNIKKNGMSKSEFEATRRMMVGQFEMSLQTNEDFIGIYGVPFLHGQSIDFYYQQNDLIKNMTLEKLNKSLKKVFSRPSHTALAGKLS
jgi:zinc protease